MWLKIKKQSGFTLLELLLAIGIFSMGAASVSYLIVESVKATDLNNKKIETTLLAREGIEAVRSIRDIDGFSTLTSNLGDKGLVFSSSVWSFSGTSDAPASGYTRVVNLSSEGDLIKVISTVSTAGFGREISTSLISYFSHWR